ncbi:MAG: phosphoesterase, partial [Frankiales bacterium]|nr:phosphoesterase [Frankiales bacterium]
MRRTTAALLAAGATALTASLGVASSVADAAPPVPATPAPASGTAHLASVRAVPEGAIRHVIVVDLENEEFDDTFRPSSPASYLNGTLVPQGQLLTQYYGIGHASTDNYLAQVSGQAPNSVSSNDCITSFTTFQGMFVDVTPGTLNPDQKRYPGQVDGQGCVYPSSVPTIGNQLDERAGADAQSGALTWRQYAEDMGSDPTRDHGTPDPLGGTDCA